jgi:hypothetical protein
MSSEACALEKDAEQLLPAALPAAAAFARGATGSSAAPQGAGLPAASLARGLWLLRRLGVPVIRNRLRARDGG